MRRTFLKHAVVTPALFGCVLASCGSSRSHVSCAAPIVVSENAYFAGVFTTDDFVNTDYVESDYWVDTDPAVFDDPSSASEGEPTDPGAAPAAADLDPSSSTVSDPTDPIDSSDPSADLAPKRLSTGASRLRLKNVVASAPGCYDCVMRCTVTRNGASEVRYSRGFAGSPNEACAIASRATTAWAGNYSASVNTCEPAP